MTNKTSFFGLVAAAALIAGLADATSAAAQSGNPPAGVGAYGRGAMARQMGQHMGNGQPQSAFVDANGDGICDNLPADGQQMQRGPRVGNGQPQSAFVDANGDGICDNLPADGQQMQRSPRGRWNR